MKKLLVLFSILASLGLTAKAETESLGIGAGAGVFDGDFGVQIRYPLYFGETDNFAVVPELGLYNQDKMTGRIDIDVHYIFRADKKIRIYPLAGFDLAIQSKSNRAGMNIGCGINLDIREDVQIFTEAKYVLSDWDGFAFTIGLYF